jgi:hypothetical protein
VRSNRLWRSPQDGARIRPSGHFGRCLCARIAQLSRAWSRSATSVQRRFATFNRSRRMCACGASIDRALMRGIIIPHRCLPNLGMPARVVAMKWCAAHADVISVVSMSGHRLFQDDLVSVSISRLRASGVVTSDTKSVDVVFGEGDEGLRREVQVVHRRFPNGGEWSFFLCPVCGRLARVLKLHGKPMCRRCCLRQGIGYRVSSGSPVERDVAPVARLHKLRELLDGGPGRLHPRPGRKLERNPFR